MSPYSDSFANFDVQLSMPDFLADAGFPQVGDVYSTESVETNKYAQQEAQNAFTFDGYSSEVYNISTSAHFNSPFVSNNTVAFKPTFSETTSQTTQSRKTSNDLAAQTTKILTNTPASQNTKHPLARTGFPSLDVAWSWKKNFHKELQSGKKEDSTIPTTNEEKSVCVGLLFDAWKAVEGCRTRANNSQPWEVQRHRTLLVSY